MVNVAKEPGSGSVDLGNYSIRPTVTSIGKVDRGRRQGREGPISPAVKGRLSEPERPRERFDEPARSGSQGQGLVPHPEWRNFKD